jgi:geranyl-CoA carboxylase beta subunit
MGGAQAAKVMEIVTRGKMERAGMPVNDAMLEGMSAEIKKRLDAESNVLFGTARLWDDGVIDPRDTRRVLSLCLDLARDADQRQLRGNTFGVARF